MRIWLDKNDNRLTRLKGKMIEYKRPILFQDGFETVRSLKIAHDHSPSCSAFIISNVQKVVKKHGLADRPCGVG